MKTEPVRKIEINHGYISPMTMLYDGFTEDMSKDDRKEFTRTHKALAVHTYERYRDEYLKTGDSDSFILNISSNCKEVIRACFDDSKFLSSLDLPVIRQLTIQSYTHEGHDLLKVRRRMKTIVKFFPYWYFSDEILADILTVTELTEKKEKDNRLIQH